VLVGAFVCKIIGGYIGARLAGLNSSESMVMGFGMNGRGVMELVIADLALTRGFITADVFSTLVLMGMVTTMATPWLLQKAFEHNDRVAFASGGSAALSTQAIPSDKDLVDDMAHRPEWVDAASGEAYVHDESVGTVDTATGKRYIQGKYGEEVA
jgi:hypothetical protein